MLHIVVVEASAESRQQVVQRLQGFLRSQLDDFPLLPRASIRAMSVQELKFNASPDICLIGPELLAADLLEVSRVREVLPHSTIVALLSNSLKSLATIEQVARLGADDVVFDTIDAEEFVRKLILLNRRAAPRGSGTLIVVDGAKGGIGITSICAALAEIFAEEGRTVALVDGDFESQDLTRFLQAKPFINESLRLLLDEQRPVTDEAVAQCLTPVWAELPTLRIMPPPPESDDLWSPTGRQTRILAGIFESLDSTFNAVVVDSGSFRGAFREMLWKIADRVLCVVSNDPASLFSSIDRVERIRRAVSPGVEVILVENSSFRGGVSNQLLRDEFSHAARVPASDWVRATIPFCKKAACWPASGGTLFSRGASHVAAALREVAERIVPKDETTTQKNQLPSILSRFLPFRRAPTAASSTKAAATEKYLPSAQEPQIAGSQLSLPASSAPELRVVGSVLNELPNELSVEQVVSRARLAS